MTETTSPPSAQTEHKSPNQIEPENHGPENHGIGMASVRAMADHMPFAAYPLDKAGVLRPQVDQIEALFWADHAQMLLIDAGRPILAVHSAPNHGQGQAQGHGQGHVQTRQLLYGHPSSFASLLKPNAPVIFMGLRDDGVPVFAGVLAQGLEDDIGPLQGLAETIDLRVAAQGVLDNGALSLVGTARALFDWHARHGFCAACGSPTNAVDAGWKRSCPSCATEHFPRTDPVAIMLPVRDEQCFLARSARFPKAFVSCLAGFIEPGESVTEACAREVLEESGLKVTHVQILHNQPWPFPSQLMLGMVAKVAEGPVILAADELAEGIWVSKAQALAMLSPEGLTLDGEVRRAPPKSAIAHWLIKHWAAT